MSLPTEGNYAILLLVDYFYGFNHPNMAELLHGLNFHIPAMSSTEQTRILHTAVQLPDL